MRRLLIVALGTVFVVAFGAAALALTLPVADTAAATDSAVATQADPQEIEPGTTDAQVRDHRDGTASGVLDELVAEGVITQGQADIITERFRQKMKDGPLRKDVRRVAASLFAGARRVVLETIGVGREEFRAAIAEGKTIGEIAEANGVGQAELVTALVGAANTRIDELVANGRLDAERAASLRQSVEEHATQLVDRIWEQPDGERRFPGRGDRRRNPHSGSDRVPSDRVPSDRAPSDRAPSDRAPSDSA